MMKKYNLLISIIILIFLSIILINKSNTDKITEPTISIYPKIIYNGDPIFLIVNASSTIDSVYYDKKKLPQFKYKNKYISIIGTDFYEKSPDHTFTINLSNGMIFKEAITVSPREKIEKPLGIPEKLGGNTKEAGKALVNNLAIENYLINNIKSEPDFIWSEKFSKSLTSLTITDTYGYNRNTVGYVIAHKGTDFRAATGTPVYALNSGVVRIARSLPTYGNTVAIDHGGGIVSLYMHMSKTHVKEGDMVRSGDHIGDSGQTGYVSAPHLHISIKINGISIDPAVFMKFFEII